MRRSYFGLQLAKCQISWCALGQTATQGRFMRVGTLNPLWPAQPASLRAVGLTRCHGTQVRLVMNTRPRDRKDLCKKPPRRSFLMKKPKSVQISSADSTLKRSVVVITWLVSFQTLTILLLILPGHNCKFAFCWICLAPWVPIITTGNTFHATTCKWHSNNLPNAPRNWAVAAEVPARYTPLTLNLNLVQRRPPTANPAPTNTTTAEL